MNIKPKRKVDRSRNLVVCDIKRYTHMRLEQVGGRLLIVVGTVLRQKTRILEVEPNEEVDTGRRPINRELLLHLIDLVEW